jgi:hypothetical protein
MQVMEDVVRRLTTTGTEMPLVSTGTLREFVVRAIHGLVGRGVEEEIVSGWGSAFARRYGSASARLAVVRHDRWVPLDYSFLIQELAPALIHKITGAQLDDLSPKLLTQGTLRTIAATCLEAVNGLPVHRIRFETLLELSYDLATRPPHPWFVESSGMSESVEYDLERAHHWVGKSKALDPVADVAELRYSIMEAVHHASSALLGWYGAFLGAGELAPLHQLHTHLRHDFDLPLWDYCEIERLRDDLVRVGESEHRFRTQLNWIQKHVINITRRHLPGWPKRVAWLNNVVRAIVAPSSR